MATTSEKIKYITSLLTKLVNNSKNIGQLKSQEGNFDRNNSYVPVYISAEDKTVKMSLNEILVVAGQAIADHNHVVNEVSGLGNFVTVLIPDDDLYEWKVIRSIDDQTEDPFKINDEIRGFKTIGGVDYYYEGIVLDSTVAIPGDLDNKNKFLITNKKIR